MSRHKIISGVKSKLGDAFALAVRPVRVTASHTRKMFDHIGQSAETFNPLRAQFWQADNYSKDEMINALDKYFQASSSALALGIVAGIGVFGSPVLAGAAYVGLNTQIKDDNSEADIDKKVDEWMKSYAENETSVSGKVWKYAAKPVSIAKDSYNDAMDDLREDKYLSATKGFLVSGFMGATLKGAGLAAMSSAGKAALLYSTASVATNTVYDRLHGVVMKGAGVPKDVQQMNTPEAIEKRQASPQFIGPKRPAFG